MHLLYLFLLQCQPEEAVTFRGTHKRALQDTWPRTLLKLAQYQQARLFRSPSWATQALWH